MKTPKTDCLKKANKSISLDSRCVNLGNTGFPATINDVPLIIPELVTIAVFTFLFAHSFIPRLCYTFSQIHAAECITALIV